MRQNVHVRFSVGRSDANTVWMGLRNGRKRYRLASKGSVALMAMCAVALKSNVSESHICRPSFVHLPTRFSRGMLAIPKSTIFQGRLSRR